MENMEPIKVPLKTKSDLVLWEDLEGAVGEGGGRGDRDGETGEPKAFSFQCMTKFTTNKKKKKN